MVSKKRDNFGLLAAVALILLASFLASIVNDRNNNLETTGQATQVITGFATATTGAITSCTVDRYVKGANTQCNPAAGPAGTKLLGTIEEYNGFGQWFNRYAIYVPDDVKGEIVKCRGSGSSSCTLPSCSIGTLQATVKEDTQGNYEVAQYGICADRNIKVASCSQNVKGRTCTTKTPEIGMNKFTGYFIDIVNWGSVRTFNYYDFYINPPVTTPTIPTHCSSNVWDGDESDLDCGGSCSKCTDTLSCWDNSDCSSGTCYFDSATQQKRTTAGIQSTYRSTLQTDIQYQGVCQGTTGGCTGACDQTVCQTDANTCNSNTNCGWDSYEIDANKKCKPLQAVCNTFGVKICNYKDFLAGDYSCLRKQGDYYTDACVGSGSVGFWNVVETYRNA